MAKATRLSASTDRNKDKRRLHLREIKDDPHAQLDSIGATLRAARLNRGEDPDHVATVLKMRRDHIEAIEDNDFTRLPGRTYAIGFVRSYARYLGLDADVMVQRFKEESAGREHDRAVELVFPDAPEEKRSANGSILVIALLIAGAIAGAYYVSMPQRLTGAATAKTDQPAVVVNEPVVPAVDTSAPTVSPALIQPSSLLTDGSTPHAGSTDVATTSAALTPGPAPQMTLGASAPAAAEGRIFGVENSGSRIAFRANAEAYILIKEITPAGKVTVFDRTLKAGESYRAPNRPGILLITGNAGGLDVEIDGKTLGKLGGSGETLRNISVDASQLVERLASAPGPAKPVAAVAVTPAPPKPAPAAPKPAPAVTAPSTASTPAPTASAPAPAPTQ